MQQPAGNSLGPTPRSVAVLGDANDLRTWSNTPYFFSSAGKRAGFIQAGLDLKDPQYARNRTRWRIKSLLRLTRPADYQWSRANLLRMWRQVPQAFQGGEIISHFQCFPPAGLSETAGGRHSFYIDQTLTQFWSASTHQATGANAQDDAATDRPLLSGSSTVLLGFTRHQRQIIAQERASYQSARFVIGMAQAAARSAVEDYQVDPKKVFVVRAGANLHEEAVEQYLVANPPAPWRRGVAFTPERPAVLGMIANDWERKGLTRLVEIAEALARRGRPVKVCIVGRCPPHFVEHPLVDAAGFIMKSEEAKFINRIGTFAVGCLLSSDEPLGISTLEALRLGVPVMGTRVGGIPDCVPADAGLLVDLHASVIAMADALEPLLFDPSRYAALCEAARRHAGQVTWDQTIRHFQEIYAGRGKHYAA